MSQPFVSIHATALVIFGHFDGAETKKEISPLAVAAGETVVNATEIALWQYLDRIKLLFIPGDQ